MSKTVLEKIKTPKSVEFANHDCLYKITNTDVGLEAYIAIHKSGLDGKSFGATRYKSYLSSNEAMDDALRLARIMSYKSALAGLPYGGAKGVIIKKEEHVRPKILAAYAEAVEELSGIFITGTDVGMVVEDLLPMLEVTDYIVGTMSNPEFYTALGICESLEIVNSVKINKKFTDLVISIQGVGKVGSHLLRMLAPRVSKVYIADVDICKIPTQSDIGGNIEVVSPENILSQNVDFFMPCALSGVINKKTLHQFNCLSILGAANNQLENDVLAEGLYKENIVYIPDYVANAGGLISVVDEFEHSGHDPKRVVGRVKKIASTVKNILHLSDKESTNVLSVSNRMAKDIIDKNFQTYI